MLPPCLWKHRWDVLLLYIIFNHRPSYLHVNWLSYESLLRSRSWTITRAKPLSLQALKSTYLVFQLIYNKRSQPSVSQYSRTHTFGNHLYRAGVPRLKLAPIMESLLRSLWPHDVVEWVRSWAQESVRRRRIPQESTMKRGEVNPKT